MAQGWSSPSSSTESERSANRTDSPARGRDTSAWAPSQIQPPAWSGLLMLELEQQQHPEHTEEPSARYASTLTQSSLVFSEDNGPDLCRSDTPSGPTPGCPTGRVMHVPRWYLLTGIKSLKPLLPCYMACLCADCVFVSFLSSSKHSSGGLCE